MTAGPHYNRPASGGERWRSLGLGCGLFAAALIVYMPALRAGFVWDDDKYVTAPDLRGLAGLGRIWFHIGATQQYFPALHSAFWLEHRLWGDAPFGYHLLNVLLHATAAWIFARVLLRLSEVERVVPEALRAGAAPRPRSTAGPSPTGGGTAPALPSVANSIHVLWPWIAAFLFVLHPVCVESVAWIAEQKNTLSTVFYMAAAFVYLKWDAGRNERLGGRAGTMSPPGRAFESSRSAERGGGGAPALPPLPYCLATLLFVLSLLSKSVTCTLPAALLVVFWWKRGKLSWRRDVVPLLPWLVLGAGFGLFTGWVEKRFIGAQGDAFSLALSGRFVLAGRAIWFYLAKLLLPIRLVFIYPRWPVTSHAVAFLPLVGSLALLAWVFFGRRRGPLAALLLFAGALFPFLGFLNVYAFLFSYVADHWQYLAAPPVMAFLAGCWGLGAARMPRLFAVVALAVVAFLGLRARSECAGYRDLPTFYRTIEARNPGCWMAANNLGELLSQAGRGEEAMAQYETAIRLRPLYPQAHYNLGIACRRAGRPLAAAREFGLAVSQKPGWAQAEDGLAIELAEAGRTDEAFAQFQGAVRDAPGDAGIRADFALALANADRPEEAVAQFEEAVRLDPNSREARANLGLLLAHLGRGEEAVAQFRESVRLDPGSAEAHLNLAVGLIRLHRVDEAVAEFREALKSDPNNPEIREDLERAMRMRDSGP